MRSELPRLNEGIIGAGRGPRTPKSLRTADFKSAAYANFAIPAGLDWENPMTCGGKMQPQVRSRAPVRSTVDEMHAPGTLPTVLIQYMAAAAGGWLDIIAWELLDLSLIHI